MTPLKAFAPIHLISEWHLIGIYFSCPEHRASLVGSKTFHLAPRHANFPKRLAVEWLRKAGEINSE